MVQFSLQCHRISQRRIKLVGFAKEDEVNRNRLIVGLVILAMFITLVIFGVILLLRQWNSGQAQVGQREPLPGLHYCNPNQVRPCILSFQLDASGRMAINILTNTSSEEFYLKIRLEDREHIYPCEKVQGFSSRVTCLGEKLPVGETLQFVMVSSDEETSLAAGTFPIIGLAIATPDIFITPTFVPAFDRPPK